jgi:N-methylhydantoinase A
VRTVLSGPATGVVGALFVGRAAGEDNLISFDMGGTSTDVSLIADGRPKLAGELEVHGYPLKAPALDIHTVGAGGGSVAFIDRGGLLKVGPRSAGAAPGPVCYGLGSGEPTVTDANVVLGTLHPAELLGGRMKIDRARAVDAVERLGARLGLHAMATAQGIVSIVTASMARAIRVISVQRGHDPREYALVAFGGAGPLHAARLARELEIPRILVPRHPGILCALGLLLSDLRTDHARTRLAPATVETLPAMIEAFDDLGRRAEAWFEREGILPAARHLRRAVDMRYAGQNYELPVEWPAMAPGPALIAELVARFERAHERMYGYIAAEEPVQAVTFRIEATGIVAHPEMPAHPPASTDVASAAIGTRDVWLPEAAGLVACAVYDRDRLEPGHRIAGPAIVEQMDATTLVLPKQTATVTPQLDLVILEGSR